MSERSMYKTRQRDMLLEYLKSKPGEHITAADVCEHFREKGTPIGQSTVYRQMEKLVDEGLLNKYILDGVSPACFEYVSPESHEDAQVCYHCKCEKCGTLIHLHCEEIEAIQSHLKKEHGFKMDPVRTVFYGLCERCAGFFVLLIAAVFMSLGLGGCGSTSQSNAGNDGLSIVTTIFPEYDWVRNIIGDNPAGAQITMLLDNGVDLHSYQPTAADILKISTCDLFIYVGGESDVWVKDALREAVNKDMVVIDLMDVLGDAVKEEEIVEGMQEEDEHDHDGEADDHDGEEGHDHDGEEGHDHDEDDEGPEYDEHIWLSLNNAAVLTDSIASALEGIDPENAAYYKANAEAYIGSINALDSEYKAFFDGSSTDILLFADRFPFRYMVDDYGLDYYAAFVGCSAETEASFETISFLAGKVDELSLKTVLTIEGSDHKIAETVIRSTQTKDQVILSLDSMQSTTLKDVQNGVTYLSIMGKNLEVLREACR